MKQDTVVLWSKSSTLDRKFKGSNPAAANFSFEVDDLDAVERKKTERKPGKQVNDHIGNNNCTGCLGFVPAKIVNWRMCQEPH